MADNIAVTEKITNFATRRHTPEPITIPDTLTFKNTYMNALIKAAKYLIFLALITPPNSVDAATKIGDLYYNLVNNEAYVVCQPLQNKKFVGYNLDKVVIPATVTRNGKIYTVTKIASDRPTGANTTYGAFESSTIKSIVIPYTITGIGTKAFWGSSVTDIDFEAAPDESEDAPILIEGNAFTNCKKLEYFELMREHYVKGETEASNIFAGCTSLKSAVLALTGLLPQGFFSNCTSLQRVEFTNHIDKFGQSSFNNCTGMMKANGGQGIYFRNTGCPATSYPTSTNEHNNIWGRNVANNSVEIHVPTYTTADEMTAWYNFATYGQVYITPVIKDETCGIEEVSGNNTPDTDAPVEYYTLQGLRTDATALTPGIYIRRQGTSVTKILIRR